MNYLKYGLCWLFGILGSIQASQAIELPYCYETACYKASYNEKTESVSIFVWKGDNEILLTNTFKVLNVTDFQQFERVQSISKDNLWGGNDFNVSSKNTATPPPPPCTVGGCSTAKSVTYETVTHYVTITYTFVFVDGELVSVTASHPPVMVPKPPSEFIEK